MNDFTFSPDAMAEFMDWIKKDKKTANKIYLLVEDIRRNGAMQGIGKPELLKHRPVTCCWLFGNAKVTDPILVSSFGERRFNRISAFFVYIIEKEDTDESFDQKGRSGSSADVCPGEGIHGVYGCELYAERNLLSDSADFYKAADNRGVWKDHGLFFVAGRDWNFCDVRTV